MNRRGFLGALTGLMATAYLDPEKLLWVPGQKKIFIPSAPKMDHYIGWADFSSQQEMDARDADRWAGTIESLSDSQRITLIRAECHQLLGFTALCVPQDGDRLFSDGAQYTTVPRANHHLVGRVRNNPIRWAAGLA